MTVTLLTKKPDFSMQHCEPCQKGTKPLTIDEASIYLVAIEGWELDEHSKWLRKKFQCKNFLHALDFANKIGEVAEKEGHHPDLELGWGYVNVNIQTHAISGLHQNDFILASKIDKIPHHA